MRTSVGSRAAMLAAIMLLSALPNASGFADKIVVPGALQNVEGNTSLDIPFDLIFAKFETARTQQVYLAAEFRGLPKPLRITEIAFRPDADWGDVFDSVLPEIVINLSTTTAAPDYLSTVFDANVGKDDQVVYHGALPLSSGLRGPRDAVTKEPVGPMEFDIRIKLQTPFIYDPDKGNLLLDVKSPGAGLTTAFDAEERLGDAVSRIFTWREHYSTPIGHSDGKWSVGLVTEFTFDAAKDSDLEVTLDIRPGSCPNPLNTASMGVLPAAIAGNADLDPSRIDPGTILLEGVAPLRWSLEDVTSPYKPASAELQATDCAASGPDGLLDLSLKFDLQAVAAAVAKRLGPSLSDGEVVELSLTGMVSRESDPSPIHGEDVVLFQVKKRK